jgi:hypothetical protein
MNMNFIQNEFYASAFRRKLYRTIEELQSDVDQWIEAYNKERTHSGKYCYGKTPYQTFLDSKPLALQKQLDTQLEEIQSHNETFARQNLQSPSFQNA